MNMKFIDGVKKTILVASIPVFMFSVYKVYDYHKTEQSKMEISNEIDALSPDFNNIDDTSKEESEESSVIENTETTTTNSSETPETVAEAEVVKRPVQKWAKKLVKRNKDAVGWIKIPGFTDYNGNEYIDYPVMQGDDNEYYLTHDIDDNYNESGSIYADCYAKIDAKGQPDNIIMFGHHMRNMGTAFTHLAEYKDGINFLKEHPIIEFNTIYEKDQRYMIFACYVAAVEESQDPDLFYYWRYRNFDDDKYDFDTWLTRTKKSSWYKCNMVCDANDDYITLSTCSNEVDNTRWVIVAKRLDESDDEQAILDSYKTKKDENIYFPPVYTQIWGNQKKYLGWNY